MFLSKIDVEIWINNVEWRRIWTVNVQLVTRTNHLIYSTTSCIPFFQFEPVQLLLLTAESTTTLGLYDTILWKTVHLYQIRDQFQEVKVLLRFHKLQWLHPRCARGKDSVVFRIGIRSCCVRSSHFEFMQICFSYQMLPVKSQFKQNISESALSAKHFQPQLPTQIPL